LASVAVVVSTIVTADSSLTLRGIAILAAGALLYRPWRWMVARESS